jgi:predicted PurR-regulated permease PerM
LYRGGYGKYLSKVIPLKDENVHLLWAKQNDDTGKCPGHTIICVVQGAFAALGYWIFGIEIGALGFC